MDIRQTQDYLKRLKHHLIFLELKLEQKDEDKSHYLRAEISALKWIVRYAEDTIVEASEHQSKWSKERSK